MQACMPSVLTSRTTAKTQLPEPQLPSPLQLQLRHDCACTPSRLRHDYACTPPRLRLHRGMTMPAPQLA